MKILYFAWLRAKAGIGGETVEPPAGVASVADLIDWLKQRSERHAAVFADLKVVRAAVNQEHVKFDYPVRRGDEIAFFPPVTGG